MAQAASVGIEMPPDFPTTIYNDFTKRAAILVPTTQPMFKHHAGANNAVAYRFRSCAEADEAYSAALASGDGSEERYRQVGAFFSFFTASLATIESLCYSLYALGQAKGAPGFDLIDGKRDWKVDPGTTQAAFARAFAGSSIAAELAVLASSVEFKALRDIRNVLAHRVEPPRIIELHAGSPLPPPAPWFLINGDTVRHEPATTAARRAWLAKELHTLIYSAQQWL